MAAQPLVLSCLPQDYNATTGECAAPFYSYAPTSFPTLSIADAQVIGAALAYLLAVAWVCRTVARAVKEIG